MVPLKNIVKGDESHIFTIIAKGYCRVSRISTELFRKIIKSGQLIIQELILLAGQMATLSVRQPAFRLSCGLRSTPRGQGRWYSQA